MTSEIIADYRTDVNHFRRPAKKKTLGIPTRKTRRGAWLRTELVTRSRAEMFAAAMAGRPDVAVAEAVRDHHVVGRDERYYVRWALCASVLDAVPRLRVKQHDRAGRACDQAWDLDFCPHLDHSDWWWCVHFKTGIDDAAIYETHAAAGCTCPDWYFRCRRSGMRCKHQLALGLKVACRTVDQFPGRGEAEGD